MIAKKKAFRGVGSSNVTGFAYNNASHDMKVTYHGGGRPGREYLYPETDLQTYRRLVSAKSPGAQVWRQLRRKKVDFIRL